MRAYPFGQRSVETVAFYGLLSDLEARVESRWADEYDNTSTVAADEASDEAWYQAQG
jgi:hypothetical protein